jgi:hypothetical protein
LGSRTIDTLGEFFVAAGDLNSVKEGSVFRLMDLYNVELTSSGEKAAGRYAGDEVTQNSRKFQWVTQTHVSAQVTVPDVLFLEGDVYNKDSLKEVHGFAEDYASELKVGDIVQFPRFGFARLDSPGKFILSG